MTQPSQPKLFFVFDVESIGLHGEGFAVGYVVVDETGKELEAACFAAPVHKAQGTNESYTWVSKNIPPILVTHGTLKNMRDAFWYHWRRWSDKKAVMVADCSWPVEARFLLQCVDDDHVTREYLGPYPLHDLASILLAKGKDPTGKFDRLDSEKPEHDPLCDARQSARILIETLKG